jgi:nucleoside-diphosphate-sugar epimerase
VCVDAGWQVRGTVRDAKHHHADLHAINHSAGSHAQPHSLTVVEVTDLAKESEEFNNAIKGCSALIHVANPIGDSAKGMSDEEFVAKSVAQVEVVMNAAAKAGVKRIVVTATMASICGSQRKQVDCNFFLVLFSYCNCAGSRSYVE